jgi:hypothetical protein
MCAHRLSRLRLVSASGAILALNCVRDARKLSHHTRRTHAVRNIRGTCVDLGTRSTNGVRNAERLAFVALEFRRATFNAAGYVTLSGVLPWRTVLAAIWRGAGAV